ncbi:MAG: class II aldolase/adducin family protein [Dehalococcoidia bacterium]|nr:class II aldolase/adducin family protein [Dehalococcoidia bacterium]
MEESELKSKLMVMSRILYKEGFLDSFGHISLRIPGKDYYYISRGGPSGKGDFDTGDLVCVDFNGNKLGGDGKPPMEAIIHTELHRTREDAMCVVHVHPYYSILMTVAGIKFVPLTIQAASFGREIPVYDPAELVITGEEGKSMAEKMGLSKALLMRGHGVVTLGASIEEAYYMTYYLEESARFLVDAHRLGNIIPMSDRDVQKRLDYLSSRDPKVSPYAKVWTYHEFKTRT